MSGSISRGKKDPGESLQMIQRPLMTPDELKSIPKGSFIVMKTGTHPMRTRLRLFLEWGITFGEPYILPERAARKVAYADKQSLMRSIRAGGPPAPAPEPETEKTPTGDGTQPTGEQTQPQAAREPTQGVPYHFGKKGIEP